MTVDTDLRSCYHKPRTAVTPGELRGAGRGKEVFFPRVIRAWPGWHRLWTSSLQHCEQIHFCCVGLPGLWFLSWPP